MWRGIGEAYWDEFSPEPGPHESLCSEKHPAVFSVSFAINFSVGLAALHLSLKWKGFQGLGWDRELAGLGVSQCGSTWYIKEKGASFFPMGLSVSSQSASGSQRSAEDYLLALFLAGYICFI